MCNLDNHNNLDNKENYETEYDCPPGYLWSSKLFKCTVDDIKNNRMNDIRSTMDSF